MTKPTTFDKLVNFKQKLLSFQQKNVADTIYQHIIEVLFLEGWFGLPDPTSLKLSDTKRSDKG